jgi:hypothetical protein
MISCTSTDHFPYRILGLKLDTSGYHFGQLVLHHYLAKVKPEKLPPTISTFGLDMVKGILKETGRSRKQRGARGWRNESENTVKEVVFGITCLCKSVSIDVSKGQHLEVKLVATTE